MTQPIVTRQIINSLGKRAYQFGVPSLLRKGEISYSLHNWATKASALRAARNQGYERQERQR